MAEHGQKFQPEKKGGGKHTTHIIPDLPDSLAGLFIVVLLIAVFASTASTIEPIKEALRLERLFDFFWSAVPFFIVFSLVISAILILGIVNAIIKLTKLMGSIKEKIYIPESTYSSSTPIPKKNEKWERVLDHINSENPSDWRLAILEADVILENLVEKMGYSGETLGEKLRNIERSDFNTIDNAWEAHKVRNYIAHQGGSFMISHREAKRVIRLYQSVFEEFGYI